MAVIVCVLLLVACSAASADNPFQVVYERKLVDFVWESETARDLAIASGRYIPRNNAISGIKVWNGRYFLAVPRWKEGVPLTLTTLKVGSSSETNLTAFPNWKMQEIGNCEAIQYVQEIEIDTTGKMWIIDSGRMIPIEGTPSRSVQCPPKLLIIDLNTFDFDQPEDATVYQTYEFPANVANVLSYLNDLVVADSKAYITDMGQEDPGIVVFDSKNVVSWKNRDKTMFGWLTYPPINVNGVEFVINGRNLDGIALSPVEDDDRQLYFCPLASNDVFSVPLSALTAENKVLTQYITKVGSKDSISDGYMMDNNHNMYFGLVQKNAVGVWNTKEKTFAPKIFGQDNTTLQWVDALAMDEEGFLYATSTRLPLFLTNQVNPEEVNYRILRAQVDSKSYMYSKK